MSPWLRFFSPVATLLAGSALALVLFPAAAAAADPSGEEILKKLDEATNAFTDGVFESKLVIRESGGRGREFAFSTYQKLPEKRLVRFSSPGDVKGMGVLVLDKSTLYVFLPGYQRVRRLGSHVKNQTFMGSDFTFEDVGQLRLSPTYLAKRVAIEADAYVLELTVKAGQDAEFPRIKLWVDKTRFVPTRYEYYDDKGRKLKTQLRSDYKTFGNYHGPGKVVMIDHRRNDHTSEIIFVGTKLNSGLGDDLFSVRSLQRGQ